jgi:hypothetical protein
MPRRDGTGPSTRSGPGTGRGASRRASGKGRMGGTQPGADPGGYCICPNCGARMSHQLGIPCYNLSCPNCGAKMARG